MAKRTERHDDTTLFKNRLLSLMEEKGDICNSARKLALALYEGRYFLDMEYHFEKGESHLKQKDIWKIEKQIIKHLNAIDGFKISGKYLIVYSLFFDCSTDYLLGLTDIKSRDLEIRQICETTGLTEKSLYNLTALPSKEISRISLSFYNELLNVVLESEAIKDLRNDWIHLLRLRNKYFNELAEITAWDIVKERVHDENGAIHKTKIDNLRKTIDLNIDSYYGRLNKMTIAFSSLIDNAASDKCMEEISYNQLVETKLDFLKQVFIKE